LNSQLLGVVCGSGNEMIKRHGRSKQKNKKLPSFLLLLQKSNIFAKNIKEILFLGLLFWKFHAAFKANR
jgi:hypothetical protein